MNTGFGVFLVDVFTFEYAIFFTANYQSGVEKSERNFVTLDTYKTFQASPSTIYG